VDLNVSLPNELIQYIESELDSGRFSSSSEVIGAALRLLEAQNNEIDADLEHLRAAWDEGMGSGDFRPLDLAALKAEGRQSLKAE
jgi:antitoxin ParD1/3/4